MIGVMLLSKQGFQCILSYTKWEVLFNKQLCTYLNAVGGIPPLCPPIHFRNGKKILTKWHSRDTSLFCDCRQYRMPQKLRGTIFNHSYNLSLHTARGRAFFLSTISFVCYKNMTIEKIWEDKIPEMPKLNKIKRQAFRKFRIHVTWQRLISTSSYGSERLVGS